MNYTIELIKSVGSNQEVKQFILDNHYLKSIARGCKFVFCMYDNGKLKGVAMFGEPVGTKCHKVYSSTGKKVIELKRFCLKDCPKNTASWFMARCISQLKSLRMYDSIISYADPKQGHEGVIYQASNYNYLGKQKYPSIVFKYRSKLYHQRDMYQDTVIGNELKKQFKLNKVKRITNPPKHIYKYQLEKRK